MALIITERYNHRNFFKNLYDNYDIITTKSLSPLLYLTPGNYRFLVSDRDYCYGIRYITYNSGKKKILPLIEGTLTLDEKTRKSLPFIINNEVNCNLMIIPVHFVIDMLSGAPYIINVNEFGEVTDVRIESEDDYDKEKGEYVF